MLKTKTIPAVEARVHFGSIIKQVMKEGKHFIVEKAGIPVLAIISAVEYERFMEEREERFEILDRIKAKVPNVSKEKVEKDISKAIQAVRKKND